jgi:protein SCO1/2
MKYIVSTLLAIVVTLLIAKEMLLTTAQPPLPTMGAVSEFELQNQDGETFTSGSLEGRVWIANFFFTSCDGPCPVASAILSRLQSRFSEGLSIVSISVDPERDTNEKLKDYAKRFRADPKNWNMLRGEIETISKLSQDVFKVGFGEAAENHSTRFILIDQDSNIRGYYSSVDPETYSKLERDICRLTADKNNC